MNFVTNKLGKTHPKKRMCVCCNLTSYTSALICTKSLRVAVVFHIVMTWGLYKDQVSILTLLPIAG